MQDEFELRHTSEELTEEQERAMLSNIRTRPSRLNAKPIGSVMRRLMSQRGYGQTAAVEALHQHWQQAVGETLGGLTRPGNISRGVLQVFAANSTAIQELAFVKRQVLRALNQQAPQLKIRDIKARIGPVDT